MPVDPCAQLQGRVNELIADLLAAERQTPPPVEEILLIARQLYPAERALATCRSEIQPPPSVEASFVGTQVVFVGGEFGTTSILSSVVVPLVFSATVPGPLTTVNMRGGVPSMSHKQPVPVGCAGGRGRVN
jgi:hypothetical protein